MNKKVVGVILIILALGLGWWAWGKIQPYVATPPAEEVVGPPEDETAPAAAPATE